MDCSVFIFMTKLQPPPACNHNSIVHTDDELFTNDFIKDTGD